MTWRNTTEERISRSEMFVGGRHVAVGEEGEGSAS